MIKNMHFFACLMAFSVIGAPALAATRPNASDFISPSSYENLYPMMNNKMRTNLNPGTTPTQTQNPISTLVRTKDESTNGRRVVSRSAKTARSAANIGSSAPGIARAGTAPTGMGAAAGGTSGTSARRVVNRSGNNARSAQRADTSAAARANTPNIATNSGTESISSSRCLADYMQCMNGYCERKNAAYNRCYCSAKLAQIDSEYQPAIDKLIKQILTMKGGNNWTDAEMKAYWDKIVGQYTGDNSWVNLDNALDIDWADTESRVRGQNAFAMGHEYCVQHLRGCYYMAANMRDAYRSEIARDCATYETSLRKIKNVAENIVESYSE